METWIRKEKRYEGRIISLRTGEVRLDDGTEAFREVIEHPGAVAVVPLHGDSVVLVRQYRVAVGKELLEVPAGKLESDEDPEQCGRRELEEETGYQADRLVPAGHIYPSCGILTEKVHLFLAFDLGKTAQKLEEDERIEVVEMPLADVRKRLKAHAFEDAKTVVGLYSLLAYQDRNA